MASQRKPHSPCFLLKSKKFERGKIFRLRKLRGNGWPHFYWSKQIMCFDNVVDRWHYRQYFSFLPRKTVKNLAGPGVGGPHSGYTYYIMPRKRHQLISDHGPACMCHCIIFRINPRVSKYHALCHHRATWWQLGLTSKEDICVSLCQLLVWALAGQVPLRLPAELQVTSSSCGNKCAHRRRFIADQREVQRGTVA